MNQEEEVRKCPVCKNDEKIVPFGSTTKVDQNHQQVAKSQYDINLDVGEEVCQICIHKMENKTTISKCIDCHIDTEHVHNRCDACAEKTILNKSSSILALSCPFCKKHFHEYPIFTKHLKNDHKKKEITLDDWKQLNLPNLKFVEKKNYKDITTKMVEEHLFELKTPLVFSNSLEVLSPKSTLPLKFTHEKGQEKISYDLFTLDYLKYKFGDVKIVPRDTDKLIDFPEGWDMKKYVEYLEKPKKRKVQHLYGKDLPCPKDWSNFFFQNENFPEICISLGNSDCFSSLDAKIQPLTLLNYIGFEGTNTPAHKDICASIGNNVMVDVQDGKSYSLWKLFKPKDYQLIEKYLKKYFQGSLDHDNCFLTTTFLSACPFETMIFEQFLGDYIIIPPNSPHQVENFGGFTTKVAWNTLLPRAMPLAYETLEFYRKIGKQQIFRIKTICYYSLRKLIQKANNFQFDWNDKNILKDFSSLIDTMAKIIQSEFIVKKDEEPGFKIERFEDDEKHTRVCDYCKQDIWNRCYHCSQCPDEVDFCLCCVAFGRGCVHRKDLKLTEYISMKVLLDFLEEAKQIYQNISRFFAANLNDKSLEYSGEKFVPNPNSPGNLSFKKIQDYQKNIDRYCHQCKEKKKLYEIIQCSDCKIRNFCETCLWNRYALKMIECLKTDWICPVCDDKCNCDICITRKDPTKLEKDLKRVRDVESYNDVAITTVDSSFLASVSDSSPNPNKYKKLKQTEKEPVINEANGDVTGYTQYICTVCSTKIPRKKRLYRCELCDEDRCVKCYKTELKNDPCNHRFVKYGSNECF